MDTPVELSKSRLEFALTNLKSLKARKVDGWNSAEKILTLRTAIMLIERELNNG